MRFSALPLAAIVLLAGGPAFAAGNARRAGQLHAKFTPLFKDLFIETNPVPVKAALAMMGKIKEVYRLPLLTMRRDTRSKLQKIATDAGLITRPAAPPVPSAEF